MHTIALGKLLSSLVVMTILFTTILSAQEGMYRGKVEVVSYDILHEENLSTRAGVLTKYTGWDRGNFDTIYQTFHICNDTLISEIRGIDTAVIRKSILAGSFNYVLSSGDDRYYLKYPKNKHQSRVGSATAKEWNKNKRNKKIYDFPYDYHLRNPDNNVVQLYAQIDRSIEYETQLNLGSTFKNIFHPYGKYKKVMVDDGRTHSLMEFYYYEDPAYDCLTRFDDYPVRELGQSEVEEVTTQLAGKETDTIIALGERKKFEMAGAIGIDSTILTPDFVASLGSKYTLVDVWASWCVPCRAEMPFLREIRSKYKDDDLAVLSISLDKKRDAKKWMEAIDMLGMEWSNCIIYNGFDTAFGQAYNIEAIPRYMILDAAGRLINDNAPRPSDEKLTTLLDQLLASQKK